ncbi:MAG: MATE family efflux transporter, partial [Catalinimonas sp.]
MHSLRTRLARRVSAFFRLLRRALTGQEEAFTTGSIDRAIFLLAVPMVLEMVMESLFAVTDAFWVGRLGVNAVATVGLTESVLTLIYSLAIGLSTAATATVARRVGEKDPDAANRAAGQALWLGVLAALVISAVGLWLAADILGWMGASGAVVAEGRRYPQIMFGGSITIMLLFLNNAIFRGAGNAALAMRALWLANGLNIALDPLLIFGWGPVPGFGVAGAAVATNLGRGVGVAYQLYHLTRGRGGLC